MSEGNYLYVMCFAESDHKIGYSNNPIQRRKELRGARSIVRTWHRPKGDARAVESLAHRLLSDWRLPLRSERERFEVNEAAACHAVECAIALMAGTPNAIAAIEKACAAADARALKVLPREAIYVEDAEADAWAENNPGDLAREIRKWSGR